MTNRTKCFHCSIANGEVPAKPQQFDFARLWRNDVEHHLDKPEVKAALELGMKWLDKGYEEGTPPWILGRGIYNGQMAEVECLSWYQPWGRCHEIAPFCWALGREMFPELNWGFITGQTHTVVVGWSDNWREPEWVMDILLFREKTAQQSLKWAKQGNWQYCGSLTEYVSTASWNPSAAYEFLKQAKLEAGVEEAEEGVDWIKRLIELKPELDKRFPFTTRPAVSSPDNATASAAGPRDGRLQAIDQGPAMPEPPRPKKELTAPEKEQFDAMCKKMHRNLMRGRIYSLTLFGAQGAINLDE